MEYTREMYVDLLYFSTCRTRTRSNSDGQVCAPEGKAEWAKSATSQDDADAEADAEVANAAEMTAFSSCSWKGVSAVCDENMCLPSK